MNMFNGQGVVNAEEYELWLRRSRCHSLTECASIVHFAVVVLFTAAVSSIQGDRSSQKCVPETTSSGQP